MPGPYKPARLHGPESPDPRVASGPKKPDRTHEDALVDPAKWPRH
ncbi:hypothetical protein [Amycolatopsis lurida]